MMLGEGDVVAMAVKQLPLLWRTFAAGLVVLSEEVATQKYESEFTLTTTGIELTEGKHYFRRPSLELPGPISALQENFFIEDAPMHALSTLTQVLVVGACTTHTLASLASQTSDVLGVLTSDGVRTGDDVRPRSILEDLRLAEEAGMVFSEAAVEEVEAEVA
jgi:hypothetical protein